MVMVHKYMSWYIVIDNMFRVDFLRFVRSLPPSKRVAISVKSLDALRRLAV